MSNFAVPIKRINDPVTHHPNADRLSLIKIGDFTCISSKLEDGSHRYNQGDYVAYIPPGSILPEWLLKRLDFWDEEKNKGTLNGPDGNRLKELKLRKIFSEGMLYPCEIENGYPVIKTRFSRADVMEGDDVAELLDIKKWEPPIPIHMSGQLLNVFGHTLHYDIDNWKSFPDIFNSTDEVVAHEKIHGTFCEIIFSEMVNDELFGENKNIIVTSKGIGAKGLAFKNVPENDGNLYVKILKGFLNDGLEKAVNDFISTHGGTIHIFGEIFGIQDLKYGLKEPAFRAFDIAHNRKFLSNADFLTLAKNFNLLPVPELYRGPFNETALKSITDGKTTFGGVHIREGIVIRTITEQIHPTHGRKVAKMVSVNYLLREGEVTEYN